ncbi:uncharacterized protein KY384_002490 [Bacidia gigantensis]|uniref:uncharacterized protein n=1 Tax=Bacidia gigantensis TaxID=2732470 RepID=UPI001D057661|nr:uncharacterized protein KY384_002490 [Bacidia gigantensis]KAG8532613.1 hypothetical protein KY384_002490 [Bacidia gigantensis]
MGTFMTRTLLPLLHLPLGRLYNPFHNPSHKNLPKPSTLPISLPPATLRPLAFRVFTKKHNLNLTSTALQLLATFIGKQCGSAWREAGLAERLLDDAAKQWKLNGGGVLVPGEGSELNGILNGIQSAAGKLPNNLSRRGFPASRMSASLEDLSSTATNLPKREHLENMSESTTSGDRNEEPSNEASDPRRWLKVINAFEQPRLSYNPEKKHFEHCLTSPSVMSGPGRKTDMARQRYHLVHQRLMRNESFQTSAILLARQKLSQLSRSTSALRQQTYKLTPIANLLGRGGSNHLLMGMLSRSPSGHLTINDPTGSIVLDLHHARPSPEDGVWFAPGMLVIVDGQYEDQETKSGSGLDGNNGVGGNVSGVFVAFGMTGPPCERREITVGHGNRDLTNNERAGAGFGWVDFLGVGSERAVGNSMRAIEKQVFRKRTPDSTGEGRARIIILGEVNLDKAKTLQALRKVLAIYAADSAENTPMAVVLIGNFVRYAAMAGGGSGGSIEYKEYFDSLASALSDFPSMLHNTTFIFVPGDHDPWPSAFSSGAVTVLPRESVPELFTSRIRRAFATANTENERLTGVKADGEAIWSTNPTRITLFGSVHEIVVFRDDISGRLRRHAVRFNQTDCDGLNDHESETGENDQSLDKQSAMLHNDIAENENVLNLAAVEASRSKNAELGHTKVPSHTQTSRKLVKTLVDQGHLSPFPVSQRPIMWDHAHALNLYPLPTALVIMDAEAPAFAIGLDGCHVMNPGCLIMSGKRGVAQWMEYNVKTRRGKVRESHF